ncbi:hypothetical protein COCNU_04G006190 [Cocos nucifera]|uniref:Uncharacterized protein n=1 Tax=Cocos nucifera TaxID=13894 RepID=A0A8K0N043_COCNU|nr:hypothetical protein COCNU_04G006190 [Cocos nucifera]
MLDLPSWGFLRELVCRAPSLDGADLESSNKLKAYQASLLPDLLKEQILFNLGLSPLNPVEMDTDAVEKLTKDLYAQKKRKGAALGGSSKRAKVSGPSFKVSDIPTTVPKVAPGIKVLSIIEGSVGGTGSQPPASSSLPIGGLMLEPSTERERGDGDDKKKKKAAVVKVVHKACSGESSNGGSDDLGVDPFDNLYIIWDLTNKFAMSEEVDRLADLDRMQFIWKFLGTFLKLSHDILAHLKKVNHQEVEALKVQGDLRAEIDCLRGKVVEAEHLMEEKVAENESLRRALRKEELISIRIKATLALKEEKKKEAEIKVAKLEVRMLKSILEAAARAMEFKASSKMKDLNIAFSHKVFIKSFKLYEGRVALRFLELDLSFLEEEPDEEAGPSDAAADPSTIKVVFDPSGLLLRCPSPCKSSRLSSKHRSNPFSSPWLPLEC